MLANEKTSRALPLGLNGLNFSRRITAKYAIFKKSIRLLNLIYLRLSGTKVTNKIININREKSINNFFSLHLNLYFELLQQNSLIISAVLSSMIAKGKNFYHLCLPPRSWPLPIKIDSMGKGYPFSVIGKENLESKAINVRQVWRLSHIKTAPPEYVLQNKMRIFALPRNKKGESIRLEKSGDGFQILLRNSDLTSVFNKKNIFSLKKHYMSSRKIKNKDLQSPSEDPFSGMTLNPQKINNQTLRRDMNIIPEIIYPGPDNNIYSINQRTGRIQQEISLSGMKEPVSNINNISSVLILKKIIRKDTDILSRNRKTFETEKIISTKINHITHNITNLIHKKTITQDTPTPLENPKNLETEKPNSTKIINENLPKDSIKEGPVQGIHMIADKVYKIIEKKIAIEKDRRGLF